MIINNKRYIKHLALTTVLVVMLNFSCISRSIADSRIVWMGDSIGEGVQGADAAWQTQVFSYVNWINFQIGGDLTLPLILTSPLGLIGDTNYRFRLFPDTVNSNVAFSGARVNSLLNKRSLANTVADISNEAELVLYPRLQSQMEYVESVTPELIICWIGNNDVLSSVTSYGNLDSSQLTPVDEFERDYIELANRINSLIINHGSRAVFANIPNVTDIGFLFDRTQAEAFAGFPVALPDGHYTTVVGALIMSILGNDELMTDPGFVLDPVELALIQDRLNVFNAIIAREASRIGMPVVDVHARFAEITQNPVVILGRSLDNSYFGGLFSLDGVHPSNMGHALIANEFIRKINYSFEMNIPELSQTLLELVFLTEPMIDKDLDGQLTGRPGVGFLETLALILGLTGDPNDFIPN